MNADERILPFANRFASKTTEAEYQHFIFRGNLRNNMRTLALLVPIYGFYCILDLLTLQDPSHAVAVRLATLVFCGATLGALNVRTIAKFQEWLVAAAGLVIALSIVAIIWMEPTLNSAYYIGLVQCAVFFSFLVRLSFLKSASLLAFSVVAFTAAVLPKPDRQEAVLEMIVLSSMCATCTFGIYILQRYRRTDFLKTKTIARQNEQLAGMLADAQLDNERKLAALNTLIHFVKTPIHQIVGFTDLIVKGLQGAPGQNVESQLEHAQFVKSASADLSANVARLLAYYRLDEEVKGEAPAKVSLASALDDFKDLVEAKVECAIESRPPELVSHAGPIRVAITSLASLCTAEESEIKTALIQWRDNKRGGIDLIFDFDGPTLTDERFADLTQPLTKLTNYLTSEGRAMPMTLRTVARAADICGGRFTYRREGRRNIFTLSLVDLSDSRAGVAIGKEGAAA